MKAATGELNLTVITLIAIAAVVGFFWVMFNGKIKESLNTQWNTVSGQNGYNQATGETGEGD